MKKLVAYLTILAILLTYPNVIVLAQDSEDVNRAYEGLVWAPDGLESECSAAGAAGIVTVDRILQTIAFHESGGSPTAQNPRSSASGKYQYIDSSWRDFTARYYPPGSAYARAYLAPESMQDALTYIEYTEKLITYEGDLFKIAITHYMGTYDESELDTVPAGGNTLTPREYAERFIENYNSGLGSDIPLYYREAPDFAIHLAAVGGETPGTSNGSVCTSIVNGLVCPATLEQHPSISEYFKMPDSPDGSYSIYSIEARRFGSRELVCALYTVGNAYKLIYGADSTFSIGDLNASGHATHNRGVANDNDATGNIVAADHDNQPDRYSTEATIQLGQLFVDTGIIKNIWWCEPGAGHNDTQGSDGSMNAIRDYANSQGYEINIKCIDTVNNGRVDHANHFHVDILDEFIGPFHEP